MAVPERNLMEADDNDDENALFEDDGLEDLMPHAPPHLEAVSNATQFGDADALRIALDNLEGSIDEPVEDGDTALHLACLYGKFSCAQLLLERGANFEVQDEDGAIPLHDACAGGYTEIVQLLINRANETGCVNRMLEAVDAEGDTPLHHAARGEHADVIRLLLASGASPTKANLYGKIPTDLPEPNTEAKGVLEAAASVAPAVPAVRAA